MMTLNNHNLVMVRIFHDKFSTNNIINYGNDKIFLFLIFFTLDIFIKTFLHLFLKYRVIDWEPKYFCKVPIVKRHPEKVQLAA